MMTIDLCCFQKWAKYFGPDNDVKNAQLPLMDQERQSRPSPSYKLSPVSDRHRESLQGPRI